MWAFQSGFSIAGVRLEASCLFFMWFLCCSDEMVLVLGGGVSLLCNELIFGFKIECIFLSFVLDKFLGMI